MSAPGALRVGWCPGALRPMMAGDGLLVRVKPRGGALSLAQATALAALAERFGNGAVTLTARANLQVRGVTPGGVDALADHLAALGLLDPSPEAEAVRNVTSSPLAGHDPSARLDARASVAALEGALVRDPTLLRLPAKFAWLVDEGGALSLRDVTADVRFEAVAHEGRAAFAVRLGDEPTRAARCGLSAVAPAAVALAGAFLSLAAERGIAPHRMRDLLAACPAAAIFERAGLPHGPAERTVATRGASPVGLARSWGCSWLSVAPPFGWLDARTLAGLARRAETAGADGLRLTPWRTILVPGLTGDAAEGLRAAIADAAKPTAGSRPGDVRRTGFPATSGTGRGPDLIVDPADPRLAVAACPGAPACHRATTSVRTDAARLAAALDPDRPPGVALHVSGCAKGCAHPAAAAVTLVGREGAYDLVRYGTASDAPALRALSAEAVAAMLPTPQPEPAC